MYAAGGCIKKFLATRTLVLFRIYEGSKHERHGEIHVIVSLVSEDLVAIIRQHPAVFQENVRLFESRHIRLPM
jgi:hypothetical protein